MILDALYYLAGGIILLGTGFSLLAAIGIVRLPDLYTRMHAASKAGTLGSGLILIALALVSFDAAVVLRAIVAIVFLIMTAPVAAHLLARAAYLSGERSKTEVTYDDLADQKISTK